MKGVILVGGFGTRLRPLTLTIPKPLIPLGNKPLIRHQIEALVGAGVSEIILAVGYGQDQLKDAAAVYEEELGVKISLSVESKPMGTAGPLSLLEYDLASEEEPFFVLNADVICQFPLKDMIKFHRKHGKAGTMLVTRTSDPSSYGVVVFDDGSPRVAKFVEKPTSFVSDKINAGIYLLEPAVFRYIDNRPMSIEREVFPKMAKDGLIYAYDLQGFWMDIGQPRDYLTANVLYLKEKHTGDGESDLYLVHPSARIGAGCVIGPGVTIGKDVVVGDGVKISNSVILEGARVDSYSMVVNSVIGWGSHLEKWTRVEGYSVFGAEVHVLEGTYINGGVVLPHKEISMNISSPQIIM